MPLINVHAFKSLEFKISNHACMLHMCTILHECELLYLLIYQHVYNILMLINLYAFLPIVIYLLK